MNINPQDTMVNELDTTIKEAVLQGDYKVTQGQNVVFTTVLGSCISACLFDKTTGIGGMNHFLLAGGDGREYSSRYGVNAMELLINGILKLGGNRDTLQAKVFGGANMSPNLPNVGEQNVNFTKKFLEVEGIPCVASSVGGTQARRIRFHPHTGRVQQVLVAPQFAPETLDTKPVPQKAPSGLKLFDDTSTLDR